MTLLRSSADFDYPEEQQRGHEQCGTVRTPGGGAGHVHFTCQFEARGGCSGIAALQVTGGNSGA